MRPMSKIQLNVNGDEIEADVQPRLLLVEFLRQNLGLTRPHMGCETTQCGACTVHLDGRAIKSSTMLAAQANGRDMLPERWTTPSHARSFQAPPRVSACFLHLGHGDDGARYGPTAGRS
ncbi:hypothetical protein DND67_17565 [Pseudomonas syringae pv. pisi]|nr:hypothetical protein DND67_17565 [Pseudomonas syringae pv. pisi]